MRKSIFLIAIMALAMLLFCQCTSAGEKVTKIDIKNVSVDSKDKKALLETTDGRSLVLTSRGINLEPAIVEIYVNGGFAIVRGRDKERIPIHFYSPSDFTAFSVFVYKYGYPAGSCSAAGSCDTYVLF